MGLLTKESIPYKNNSLIRIVLQADGVIVATCGIGVVQTLSGLFVVTFCGRASCASDRNPKGRDFFRLGERSE